MEDHIDKYWFEISDLTIFEAAFWMVIGGDPRSHKHRCACDGNYEAHFYDHPGGAEAVHEKCLVIESAIRANSIKVTKEEYLDNRELDFDRTRINKPDWLNWCYHNGHKERFAQTAPAVIVEAGPIAPTISEPMVQASPAAKGQDVPVKSPSGDNNKPNSTAKLVYWRATLYSKIKQIDVNKKASVREIIKYLRRLGDSRLPDKGGHDELFWIDDNETEQRVQKKAVSNAASTARKRH